jgi:hypothetical protein
LALRKGFGLSNVRVPNEVAINLRDYQEETFARYYLEKLGRRTTKEATVPAARSLDPPVWYLPGLYCQSRIAG